MWTLNMTIVVCFFLRDAGRIRILFAHLQPDLKLKLHRSIFRAAFQSLHKSLRYSRMAASTIFIYFVAFALTFNWFSILHFSPIPNRYVWINVFAFLWHERVDYLLQFSFLFMRLRILSKASRVCCVLVPIQKHEFICCSFTISHCIVVSHSMQKT